MATDNQHFPSDLVRAIQESVTPEFLEFDGLEYSSHRLYLPPTEPTIDTLDLTTLSGVVGYRKRLLAEPMFIHVISPTQVALYGPEEGRYKQRDRHVLADCKSIIGNGFRFGEFMEIEQFIINLQAQFVATDERAMLLAVVGNLASENVRTLEDDGVSQAVEVKTRMAQRNVTRAPNPISLRPYRTFPEVEQPASDFVFRLKQGKEGQMPQAAHFAADGGRWKIEAITAIAEWIDTQLSATEANDTRVIA
jgi:hypothetical protein